MKKNLWEPVTCKKITLSANHCKFIICRACLVCHVCANAWSDAKVSYEYKRDSYSMNVNLSLQSYDSATNPYDRENYAFIYYILHTSKCSIYQRHLKGDDFVIQSRELLRIHDLNVRIKKISR